MASARRWASASCSGLSWGADAAFANSRLSMTTSVTIQGVNSASAPIVSETRHFSTYFPAAHPHVQAWQLCEWLQTLHAETMLHVQYAEFAAAFYNRLKTAIGCTFRDMKVAEG